MVTTETHQSQDLLVPLKNPEEPELASPSFPSTEMDPDKLSQGPVNAITVLTLLDKLVNMLDTVQENQHKMETHQVEMEDVVRGIQVDITKLSKNHSHTSNTVSKLLDKSRKLSVTMKEEENEIPSTVFVKDAPPFPRDGILEEGDESAAGTTGNQEDGLQTIDLSSDEDVGLEADQEEEEFWPHDLDNMEKSRAEKLKRSSLKKVDSLKKAFTRENIEKKMNKIKQKTSVLKVSPQMFNIRKPRSSSDSQPPEGSPHTEVVLTTEAEIQLSPPSSSELEVPFTEVHAQLAPAEEEQEGEKKEEVKQDEEKQEEEKGSVMAEADESMVSEAVGGDYALSSTLPQEEEGTEEGDKSQED